MAVAIGIRRTTGVLSVLAPWGVAWRNLFQDRIRFMLSVFGIALAVMLILFLMGFNAGIYKSVNAYLDHAPGSVIVMPEGAKTSLTPGRLPAGTDEAVSARLGTDAKITPVLVLMAIPELHGKKEVIVLTGYDPARGGGPWNLAEGREPAAENEVVLDRSLADRHAFTVGDLLDVGGMQLTLVGLSNETSSVAGTRAFARKTLVESLALAPGAASYLLVAPGADVNPADTVEKLRDIPGTNVLLKSDVMANDRETLSRSFSQIIYTMVAAAFVVGALVVGMVIYTATIERRSEYGVMKAIGARGSVLYRVVALQAIVAAAVGVLIGIGFAFLMAALVETFRPQFLVEIEPRAIEFTVAAGFVMALLGGLVPARAVTRLAPADVFRR